MKTNQTAEPEQQTPTFPNPVNQMSYFQIQPIICPEQNNESQPVHRGANATTVSLNKLPS